jgi:hypothetical protein
VQDCVFVGLRCSSGVKGAPTTIPHRTVAAEAGPEGATNVCMLCSGCNSLQSCVCGTRIGSGRIEHGVRR